MNTDEIATRVRTIIAKTFNKSAEEIDCSTTADDVDGWDSLAHATLIMRIEKSFNIDLDSRAASDAQNVGALINLTAAAVEAAA